MEASSRDAVMNTSYIVSIIYGIMKKQCQKKGLSNLLYFKTVNFFHLFLENSYIQCTFRTIF